MVRRGDMTIKSLPLFILISSGLLNAAVVPGRWDKVDSLPPGQQIIVTLKAGDSIECSLKESGTSDLTVVTSTGRELKIAKSEVYRIVAEKSKDSLLNGALIGAGVGLGIALAGLAAAGSGEGEVLSSAKVFAPLLGVGAGLGVGMAIDASRQRTEVLYQAP
jgi:hypothetical protein